MLSTIQPTEAEILEEVVSPKDGNLSPEAARALLGFTFSRSTAATIRRLLKKNSRATITTEERLALERYLRVGHLVDLLHAKAQLSLQRTNS